MIANNVTVNDCVIELPISGKAQAPCAHVDGRISRYPRYRSWAWENVPIAEAKEQQAQEDGEIEVPAVEARFIHDFQLPSGYPLLLTRMKQRKGQRMISTHEKYITPRRVGCQT